MADIDQGNQAKRLRKQIKHSRMEWDFQIARSVSSLSVWRALAIIEALSLVVCVISMGSYMQKPKLLPYVVEVKDEQINFKGMMRSTPLTLNDAVVRNYLLRFVTNLRTISSDLVVLKTNLRDVYTIASTSAQRQITEMIQHDKPFEQSTHGFRRDLQITLFQHETEKTWRVEWIEEIRVQGNLKDTLVMSGTFTYAQGNPSTDIEAEKNPFGLYITEFYISQRRQ
jgi:type IV secretion system protein VirB5